MEAIIHPCSAIDEAARDPLRHARETFRKRLGVLHAGFGLADPREQMRACIIVPVRNEEAALPHLIAALAAQRDLRGELLDADSFEALLLLNNCTDGTAEVVEALKEEYPHLRLRSAEVSYQGEDAHVGTARQALFDLAFRRFRTICRPQGLILSTDADSRPALDWIAQNEAEIAAGVDGVGGRITLERAEAASLPPGVWRLLVIDIGWRRALEELRHLFAPDEHDPFPRHHQHFGASLAVTAAAYGRAHGMPLRRSNEDVALFQAVLAAGGRFRHSYRARVFTSARMIGRAHGGLADAIHWWNTQAREAARVLVESADAATARLAKLGIWRQENPGLHPPSFLSATPEPPPPGAAAEIHSTLRALREVIARLRPLSRAARLELAQRKLAPSPRTSARPILS